MPKIFEYFGFIFYFYSNEHEPIHVHVIHGAMESIFDLIMMDGELVELHVRENGNIVWGKNWDLVFPIEQLHAGTIV